MKVVWLKANIEEGFLRERAQLIRYNPKSDTYLVKLVIPNNPDDDGLREVTEDQIEESN